MSIDLRNHTAWLLRLCALGALGALGALSTTIGMSSAFAASDCKAFKRQVALPPGTTLESISFRKFDPTLDPTVPAKGLIIGVGMRADLSITNVGTLPQTVYVELNDVNINAFISGSMPADKQYNPSPWTASAMKITANMKANYNETKVDAMTKQINVDPGETVRMTLGLGCTFDGLSNCVDIGSSAFASYTPDYGTDGPPIRARARATFGGKICVRGPAGKEPLGAVTATATYSTNLRARLTDDNVYVEETDEGSEVSVPVLSGLAF